MNLKTYLRLLFYCLLVCDVVSFVSFAFGEQDFGLFFKDQGLERSIYMKQQQQQNTGF